MAISRDPITPNRDNFLRARARRPSPRRLHFSAAQQGAAQPSHGGAADESGSTRHGGIGRDQARRAGVAGTAGRAHVSADTAPQRKAAAAFAAAAAQDSCSPAQRGAGAGTSGGEERSARGVPTLGRRSEIVNAVTEGTSACCAGCSACSATRLAAGSSWRIRPRPGQPEKSKGCQSTISVEAWSLETWGKDGSQVFGSQGRNCGQESWLPHNKTQQDRRHVAAQMAAGIAAGEGTTALLSTPGAQVTRRPSGVRSEAAVAAAEGAAAVCVDGRSGRGRGRGDGRGGRGGRGGRADRCGGLSGGP